jgi:hypothetical protein
MPGDPKECRQHAERCGELARMIRTIEEREKFQALQMTWIRLAAELERMTALIEAVQELEKQQPIKRRNKKKGAGRSRRKSPTCWEKVRLG